MHNEAAGENAGNFNIKEWRSSYSGEVIASAEMREWVEETVERIVSLQPRAVLEIGCGMGLLLLRIAPQCDVYYGTDFSQKALDYVWQQLEETTDNVSLEWRHADDFKGWEKGEFDTIILNSVVQYFPDADYLVRVLREAVEKVRPGGKVYVGDIRHYGLLRAFHTSVAVYRAAPQLSIRELKQQIEQYLAQEEELNIDPGFFAVLGEQLSGVSRVEIELKRSRYHNEMSCFRYDVVLHIGGEEEEEGKVEWIS